MRSAPFLACLGLLLASGARADDAPSIAPKVKTVLDAMVKAYRSLSALDQETTYSEDAPGGIVKSRLVVQRPNKLLLEVLQKVPERAQPVVARFLCDGKEFFTYQEAQGWYTREKAPKNLAGFREIASSLEMAMLVGLNPFETLTQQARAARLEEPAQVDAVMTDVVLVDVGSDDRTGEARFYIGQEDRLLRRFTFHSKPIPKPDPSPPAQPEPPLYPDETPSEPAPPPPPRVIAFHYDNHLILNRAIPRTTFTWTTPPGALLYQPLSSLLAPQNPKKKPGITILGKPLDTSQPTRVLTQRDLFEMAKRQRRRR